MKTLKIIGVSTAILIAVIGGLWVSGLGGQFLFWSFTQMNEPAGEFDPADAVAPPDYALAVNWAALPTKQDPADLVPAGIAVSPQGDYPVDVFFIHPTGFLTSGSWTSPMELDSGTEQNTEFMMANMSRAYNGCCNVYAPRYREANIFAYMGSPERRSQLLGFAYQDVRRAFEHYLEHDNNGRPFVLASHSQGTHHAMKLLQEVIDPSELRERMVAAYTLGAVLIPLSPAWFASMDHIKPCERADDLHCVVHWDTMPEGTDPIERDASSLCTNPLTWQVNEEVAETTQNVGAVVPEGTYNMVIGDKPDVRSGDSFTQLDSPVENLVQAQCRDGSLFVPKQESGPFKTMAGLMANSYHGLDYALFYMDIHENAKLRVSTYLNSTDIPEGQATEERKPGQDDSDIPT